VQQLIERLEVELDDVTEVEVAIVGGELSIAEGDGPLRLQAEVLDGPPVAVDCSGGVVRIRHQDRTLGGLIVRRMRANVRLRVPTGTPVRAAVVSADMLLDGLTGPVSANTVSGDVTATALTGSVQLRTVSGDVGLQHVDGTLSANSVSGDVTISDGRLTDLFVRTVSGDVMADLEWAPESNAEVATVSGDAVLRVPSSSGLHFDASTLAGDLRCDLPLVVDRADRRHLIGIAGNGSSRFVARTTSGDVTVLAR
jgi:DUF4097 and DUF4098 domain-containing protein YvlB